MLKAFKRAPEIVEPVLQTAIVSANLIVHESAVNRSNTPWVTGVLAGSFNMHNEVGRLYARIYPWVKYAGTVQWGKEKAEHTTFNRTSAFGRKTKPYQFTMMWPTFQGRHYMEKILKHAQPKINEVFKNALANITEKLAKE